MHTLLQDVRYAGRMLLRRPGFALVAVLTIALGVGANTALFTAVNALVLRPLPVREPDRLVGVQALGAFGGGGESRPFALSFPHFEALRERGRAVAELAARADAQLSFGDEEYAEEVLAAFVSGDYFRVLGIRPALGRLLAPSDDRRGAATAGVVLSDRLWRRRFGADPSIVGRTVRLNGRPATVVGVAPASFTGTGIDRAPGLWAPLALRERVVPNSRLYSLMWFGLEAIGRLRPGISIERAQAELSAGLRQVGEALGGPLEYTNAELHPLSRIPTSRQGSFLRFFTMLAVATSLVLLIAGVNVAGMLLARAAGRQREVVIRAAIGAGRARIVRQLLTEGVLLFLLGGAGGVLLAVWLTDLLLAFRWPVPVTLDLAPDGRVLGFALLLSLVTGLGFSLIPALRASRPELVPARDGGRSGRRPSAWLRHGFVVGQVAMSLLLLVAAGLFLRALQHALSIDPGFDPDDVWVASIDLQRQRYDEPRGRQLYDRILERVRQVPGVRSASFSVGVPLGPGEEALRVRPAGAGEDEGELIHANVVGGEYFRTMGIPVLRGRTFATADREDAPHAAIVNQTMAEHFWPGQDPIGKRFVQAYSAFQIISGQADGAEAAEFLVVGVVPDGKYSSLREEPEPFIFVAREQNYRSKLVLAVRTEDDAGATVRAVRDAVHALDPALPLLDLTPLTDLIGDDLLTQRIGAVLTTLFGLLGLLLAAVGIYGVMAYSVGQRTREIGIRMALGAESGSVLRMILRQGLTLALLGVAIGLAAAFALTRFVSSLLYGVSATDPLTFAGVALILAAVALLASHIPARRAAGVNPMEALRAE
ncbi:MAG TPA: ABC transporter permease [Longimicrobiales bacterium]